MSDIQDILSINAEAMRLGAEQERLRIRDGAVGRMLEQYDEVTPEMILTGRFDGAQQFRGKWYVPKWGCYQLDHIVDAMLGVEP